MESRNSDMQQSQIYNYLHVVFATKYRRPLISPALSDVIGRIKGTTSYRINREFPASIPFAWQDGYYAVSVSPFGCERVIAYIRNQKRHHSTGSCTSELEWA